MNEDLSPASSAPPPAGDKVITPNPVKRSKFWQPPSVEELQVLLPQYEITKLLGRGGMGAVYQGRQLNLDRAVAIKILPPGLDEVDDSYAERFKNEARAMARLNHPGIVAVHDSGEAADGTLYIVMEYVEGTDVSRMVARQGRLPAEHALAITAHVCDALQYAHERGIIHRDIKPANIMLGYDGVVKVADFGLAKINQGGESGLTRSGTAMGTLHYMAPETLTLGAAVDHRADLYAVGVMLFQMLTGSLPQGMFEMPSEQVPGTDPRFDAIIIKALRNDRDLRYQSAEALRADLDAILTQPVAKVSADDSHAHAALPTDARPQRPEEESDREIEETEPVVIRRGGSFLRQAALLVLGSLAAGFYWEKIQNTPPKTAASAEPTTPPAPVQTPSPPTATTPPPPATPAATATVEKPAPVVPEPTAPASTAAASSMTTAPVPQPTPTIPVAVVTPPSTTAAPPSITPLSKRVRTQSTSIPADALSYKTSRYKFVPGPITWNDAKRRAEVMGGHLATITSSEEQRWLQRSLPPGIKAVTLGGELTPNGKWRWITGEPWSFTAWARNPDGTGEPNGAGPNAKLEYMTYFYGPDGGWNDLFEDEAVKINQSIRAFLVEWDNSAPLSINDARVSALDDSFAAAYEKDAAQPWREAMSTLREQYLQALQRRLAEIRPRPEMRNAVSIIEAEIALIRSGQNMPADIATDHPVLTSLRKTYRDTAKRHLTEREKVTIPLYDIYTKTLATYEAELLRNKRKNEAYTIKALREAVQNRQITPLAEAPLTTTSSSAPIPAAPAPPSFPLKQMFVWSDTQGKDILADFVGIESDLLVMRLPSQAIARMPMNTLAAGSRQLALDLQTKPGQPVWTPLCDGTTLVRWKGDTTGYQIISAVLTSTATGSDLISDKEYGSFHLKFDLRLSPGGNSGIGVWCAEDKGTFKSLSHTGFEIQLLDDNAPLHANMERWQQHASIYGMQGPDRKTSVTTGVWASHEVIVQNDRVTVIIDGATVQDADLPRLKVQDNFRPPLDISKRRGHLVLCGRKGPVEFRNMRIKAL
ncbi:protein kinase [Prosthecobacter sp.]|uniref:protein kinase domain-containing protein n=1 Tax=Prosthecobacter sp. TaxID=1965333 RepID=UPI002ABCDF37|nr:protein kinase [Prosthecobacter sp.]MDZ4403462.1 protein kinase [Prosthecobacter sp.]